MRLIISCLLISIFFACGTPSDKPTTATKPVTTAKAAGEQLPSIPYEEVKHLFDNCDYIDYVFYTTNFSISQGEKASIQGALSQISQLPANMNPSCKPVGRIFYQIDGENVLEADFFFTEGCKYLVFHKKGKKLYSNLLTDNGVAYFENIFSRAAGMDPSKQ